MRGTAGGDLRRRFSERIIPGRAGNSGQIDQPGSRYSDHPRACGEQQPGDKHARRQGGSSPGVRGTGSFYGQLTPGQRIIPGRAGNRKTDYAMSHGRLDHPRACGEQLLSKSQMKLRSGSSPGVRGTDRARRPSRQGRRIIPGRAGNSRNGRRREPASSDHPRACGEQAAIQTNTLVGDGSSPGVRGTGTMLPALPRARRIIPGRAGNSNASIFLGVARPDHPRACGEQLAARFTSSANNGSSPGVRGTGHNVKGFDLPKRIIPGRAGNRFQSTTRRTRSADHPRACGEQTSEF